MTISSKPPESNRNVFVHGNDEQTTIGNYPWDDPAVRSDIRKVTSLRLTEPYALKLKWLATKLPESQHKICEVAVTAAIDAKVAELTRKE